MSIKRQTGSISGRDPADISAARIPEDLPLSPDQAADKADGNRQAYDDAMRARQASFGRSNSDEEAFPDRRG